MKHEDTIPTPLKTVLDVVRNSRSNVTAAVLNSSSSKQLSTVVGNKRSYSMLQDDYIFDDQFGGKLKRDDQSSDTASIDQLFCGDEESSDTAALNFVHQRRVAEYLLKSNQLHVGVDQIVTSWGSRMKDIDPVDYLQHLLKTRGYDREYLVASSLTSIDPLLQQKRTSDYGCDIVNAVRLSDVITLMQMQELGRCMSACNKYSESIVHMACRRSTYATVKFILNSVNITALVDDYGRTPLHDACWRSEPCFEIVALLMDTNLDLVRCKDSRGSTPLHYVRREHWQQWCAFLHYQKEIYWAPLKHSNSATNDGPTTTITLASEKSQVNPKLW
jgi:hypothetical protein